MRTLRVWIIRLQGMFRKQQSECEMQEEIATLLALHVADHSRAGLSPEEARRQAVLQIGGMEALKEAYRERSSAPVLEHLALDIRFTFRQLRKNPGFAVTAMLVLTLALCASVTIFAFVEAALIKPLPYPAPNRLVLATESNAVVGRANLSYLDYSDWRSSNHVFDSLAVSGGGGSLLKTATGVEPVQMPRVSTNFFRTLGVRPMLGRDFDPGQETPGGSHTLLLTYQGWQHRFSGRTSALGTTVTLDGEAYTIIAVLPPEFQFAPHGAAEFWTTIDPKAPCAKRRSCHNLDGIARLKTGVTVPQAQAEMTLLSKRLERQYPDSNRGQGAAVLSLRDAIAGDLRPILLALLGGTALLLAIACVNVASLLLVRSESRRREMALRRALGASTLRLVTQFITEGVVLVTGASVAGCVLAHWTTQGLTKLIPAEMLEYLPFLSHPEWNWRIVAYVLLLSGLAVVVFSLTPTLHLRAAKMRDGLAEGGRWSAGRGWRRLGARLVVVELSLAMVLLVGAGLLTKSLDRLMRVQLGFHADHLATIEVSAPDNQSVTSDQSRRLARDIVRSVAALPGARSVALTTSLPVGFNGNTDWIRFVGKPYDGKHIEVNERDVSSDYFHTIGATLLRGRYFTDGEDESKPKVVIINETLARKYFPAEDPLGKQIGNTDLSPDSLKTIVGVVRDIRDGALDAEIWPAEYLPFNQDPSNYFSLIVRTSGRPENVLPALRPAIRKVRADVGTREETTLQALIANSMTAYLHRSSAWLVGAFAFVAFLLGVVGLYGVGAYSVTQRTREIGVRMALGAERGKVYRLILGEAGGLVVMGIAAGAVGSILAAASAHRLLFGVSSWDTQTLLTVAALLGAAALAASFVPARRATQVSPMEALRAE